MAQRATAYEKLQREGVGGGATRGLGEMPLTLFVVVAGVVLYLYIRRANLGIDLHPTEKVAVRPQAAPAPKGATVTLAASVGG